MSRPTVLIVDDDDALTENLGEILASTLDADFTIVPGTKPALAAARAKPFDLALVDVRLPDGDGTALIPQLRLAAPFGEVILMTGDATVESAVAAVRGGAFAYLCKPVSPPDLIETARRALGQVTLRRERAHLQQELERSERTHRDVVEAVPALVLALDGHGCISVWNQRLATLTGYSRSEMLGKPGQTLIGPGGLRPLPTKDGKERLVRWERADVSQAGSSDVAVYAVGTDVSTEQEMLRRTLRAERLAAVGTLAAGLAHEVRNPLNSALLQLEVLGRRIDKGNASPLALRPVVGLVQEEIRRLERLVNDFLAFAQPRSVDLQPTALAELCGSVLAFVTPEAEASAIRLINEIGPTTAGVSADPERLRQVLMNLVRNALEAMPEGGTVTLRTRNADRVVEIDVEDTGPGFPDETPIFDAFFTTKPKGTGLGLAIVHRIVADHGGTIRVESAPGRTCFTVCLPQLASVGQPP